MTMATRNDVIVKSVKVPTKNGAKRTKKKVVPTVNADATPFAK
jgi:hypothetical protein